MVRSFNETSEDRIVKYTINFPLAMDAAIKLRTGRNTKYGGIKATYIRELVENDLMKFNTVFDRPTSMDEVEKRERAIDPARKYMGFVGGLKRNSFVYNWFIKKSK